MTATLTSRIEWVVSWVVDGDTMGERYTDARDAAEHVTYLESQSVQVWIDRVESFTADDADRGIAVGSEWIATPGIEPGQLWERLADATLNQDALTAPQWHRVAVVRNQLGTRRPNTNTTGE